MENNIIKLTRKNDIKGVKKFIADGGDINMRDEYGNTALMIANYYGYTKIAEIIELLTISLENRLKEKELKEKEKELKEKEKELKERFEGKERTIKEELIKEFEERKKMMTEGLIKEFEKKAQKLLAEFEKKENLLIEKEGKLLAGFQTKFNGLQYKDLNDLQSAKFISDYEKRIICGLLPMPIAKINN